MLTTNTQRPLSGVPPLQSFLFPGGGTLGKGGAQSLRGNALQATCFACLEPVTGNSTWSTTTFISLPLPPGLEVEQGVLPGPHPQ